MDKFNLIMVIIAGLILIAAVFFICSNVGSWVVGICIIPVIAISCFLTFELKERKTVMSLDGIDIHIINISYTCPKCDTYISSLETKFCGRCGQNLEYIQQLVKGK